MNTPNISVIVNAHREGLLAVSTIRSLRQAIKYAESQNLRIETIAVLDRSDDLTVEVFTSQPEINFKIIRVDHGDLGTSRNAGALHASGDWIAYLDADDLWCENWLAKAFISAETDKRMIVWHPEANLYFGVREYIFRHVDMDDTEYDPLSLMINNYWTALCFTRRSTLLSIPYTSTDLTRGIGYEDWSWNREVISQGGFHKIVKGTAHAIRAKDNSLLRMTGAAGSIPRPTEMYRNILTARSVQSHK